MRYFRSIPRLQPGAVPPEQHGSRPPGWLPSCLREALIKSAFRKSGLVLTVGITFD